MVGQHRLHRVKAEAGNGREDLRLAPQSLPGEVLHQLAECPIVRQERRQLQVGIRGGGNEIWVQQHGLGDDVEVLRVLVESVGIISSRVRQQDLGQRLTRRRGGPVVGLVLGLTVVAVSRCRRGHGQTQAERPKGG